MPLSILSLLSLLLVSCGGNGPTVDVCLSYPTSGGFICVDKNQKAYKIPFDQSEKYVAFSPDDAQKLISSCRLGKGQAVEAIQYYNDVKEQIDMSLDEARD